MKGGDTRVRTDVSTNGGQRRQGVTLRRRCNRTASMEPTCLEENETDWCEDRGGGSGSESGRGRFQGRRSKFPVCDKRREAPSLAKTTPRLGREDMAKEELESRFRFVYRRLLRS